jgi:hypothetical protein
MEKDDRFSRPGSHDMKIYAIPSNTFIMKLRFFQWILFSW